MTGLGEVILGVGSAGDTPALAAHRLGVRFILEDDVGGEDTYMMCGRDYVAVRRGHPVVEALWGWAGLLTVVSGRHQIAVSDEALACAVAELMLHAPKKSASGTALKALG